jgi:hypothetical protein
MIARVFVALGLLASCEDREQPRSIQREMPEIVRIPGGAFKGRRLPCENQGTDSGVIDVELHVNGFAMDRMLVSCTAYARCVDARACKPLASDVRHGDWPERGCDEGLAFVPASAAADYCTFVGGRVPSSIEWQRAIRGTDAWIHPGGADQDAECSRRTSYDVVHPRCLYVSRDDVTYVLRSFGREHVRDRDCAASSVPGVPGKPHAQVDIRGSDLRSFDIWEQPDASAVGYFRCVYPPHDK